MLNSDQIQRKLNKMKHIETYFNCPFDEMILILRILRIREIHKYLITYPCYYNKMNFRISPTMVMPMMGGEATVLIRVTFSAN